MFCGSATAQKLTNPATALKEQNLTTYQCLHLNWDKATDLLSYRNGNKQTVPYPVDAEFPIGYRLVDYRGYNYFSLRIAHMLEQPLKLQLLQLMPAVHTAAQLFTNVVITDADLGENPPFKAFVYNLNLLSQMAKATEAAGGRFRAVDVDKCMQSLRSLHSVFSSKELEDGKKDTQAEPRQGNQGRSRPSGGGGQPSAYGTPQGKNARKKRSQQRRKSDKGG